MNGILNDMTKIKDISMALSLIEETAIKYADATEQVDYKTGNKNYALTAKAITFFKVYNSIERLSEFLNYDSVGVRMWATTYLLSVRGTEVCEF